MIASRPAGSLHPAGFDGCLRIDVSQNPMASRIHPSAAVYVRELCDLGLRYFDGARMDQ